MQLTTRHERWSLVLLISNCMHSKNIYIYKLSAVAEHIYYEPTNEPVSSKKSKNRSATLELGSTLHISSSLYLFFNFIFFSLFDFVSLLSFICHLTVCVCMNARVREFSERWDERCSDRTNFNVWALRALESIFVSFLLLRFSIYLFFVVLLVAQKLFLYIFIP